MRSRLISCTGLVSLTLLAALAGCGKKADAPAAPATQSTDLITYAAGSPELDSIQTVTAAMSPLPVSDDMNARLGVDESETSRVGAPIAGRVTRIMADIGQTVRAGQPLAYLDAPDIGQARADVLKARADNDRKAREMQRSNLLYSGGAIARRDLEGAQADASAASAELERARLRLGNLGQGAGDSLALTSTVTGAVVDRQINPGQQIAAGQSPLFTVTDPKKLWLYVDVPETSISRARIGEKIEFDVPAFPDRRFEGKISQIGLAVDPGTRRVQVRAEVANPDMALKPEMYARARLVTDDGRRAVKVPNAALFEQGMQTYLFRVEGPGRFRRIPVKVSQRGDSASYVTDGIKDGDRIVGEGALLLNAQLAGD
ncbi:efflux RND transporter periplasmic adaptor subunit [Sphingomonas sp. AP4-R1]|uniref:efflux RND transporter periplasmic adaptor subunit n=1 Tax=Sphingomonas sp. AP4-R1 TaxID=2735134 RepID=UPI001493CB49|nr:efflux RND transporter periplasmic adaptor subunit [Sphingomonas sp. AP4-R1]QJU59136.1 efflux RND transporter periplasmic adaptor subunit [Sphingomonas sp. AP4-R1]